MVDQAAWSDFIGMVKRSRDSVVGELITGVPNRYGERGDDEKRAIIYAFNIVLRLYDDIEKDNNNALQIIREYEARKI